MCVIFATDPPIAQWQPAGGLEGRFRRANKGIVYCFCSSPKLKYKTQSLAPPRMLCVSYQLTESMIPNNIPLTNWRDSGRRCSNSFVLLHKISNRKSSQLLTSHFTVHIRIQLRSQHGDDPLSAAITEAKSSCLNCSTRCSFPCQLASVCPEV